jgi:GntR family galactonate operon transcriptional repressor
MGLHRQVVEGIGRRIGRGDLQPGDVVDITEVQGRYGASRTAVREAIKVLSAKGLVAARPHYGTYVLPRDEWNAFDVDVLNWQEGSPTNVRLLRNLDEVRRVVEPQAARLAATRRLRAELRTMQTALRDLERAQQPPDLAAADIRFHRSVLAATHNDLLEQLGAVLQPVLLLRDLVAYRSHPGDPESMALHGAVLTAVEAQDPDAAEDRMHELLRKAAKDAERAARRRPPSPQAAGRSARR